jgi:hypothetical protein
MLVKCKLHRPGGTTIEVNDKKVQFLPNELGDHVASVEDPAILHRLVNEIPLAYELYGEDKDKTAPRPARNASDDDSSDTAHHGKTPATMFVKNSDGEEIDLMDMDKADLAEFALEQFGITSNHKTKPEAIRSKIIEAIRVASTEE